MKAMKSDNVKRGIKKYGIKKPGLDVVTRWNSMYMMMESLWVQRDSFVKVFQESSKDFGKKVLAKKHWNFIETFVEAFSDAYEFTKLLQSVQLTTSK